MQLFFYGIRQIVIKPDNARHYNIMLKQTLREKRRPPQSPEPGPARGMIRTENKFRRACHQTNSGVRTFPVICAAA